MERLSLKSYGWKCVLGAEIVYTLCVLGYSRHCPALRGLVSVASSLVQSICSSLLGFSLPISYGCTIQALLKISMHNHDEKDGKNDKTHSGHGCCH